MDLIDVPVPSGTAEAYLSRPPASAGSGPRPGVLLCMDALGLRPQIAAMADRIAGWGYVVLAPNVFHETGSVEDIRPKADLRGAGEREAFMASVRPHMSALTSAKARVDLTDYLATLRGLDGVAEGPVGITGYCMGARLAMWAAGDHPDEVAAVGGFHGGRLVTEDEDSPHRSLATTRAELVLGHADADPSMPAEDVSALGDAIDVAGLVASNEVYAGAAHGYTMADTSTYDEAAAERHFTELEALLARRL